MVGYVDGVDGEAQVFAEVVADGGIEGGVDGQVGALIRALAGAGQAIREAGAVVDVGGEPGVVGRLAVKPAFMVSRWS